MHFWLDPAGMRHPIGEPASGISTPTLTHQTGTAPSAQTAPGGGTWNRRQCATASPTARLGEREPTKTGEFWALNAEPECWVDRQVDPHPGLGHPSAAHLRYLRKARMEGKSELHLIAQI